MHIFPQPLYSKLKNYNSETIEKIQRILKAMPEGDFNSCFEDWKIHWHKSIVSGGDYFEGGEIDLEEKISTFWNK